VLEALEVAPDPGVQGSSVCGSLDGGAGVRRREVFTEQNYHVYLDASRAVRTDRFKLIANFSPGRSFFDSSQSWRPATRVAFIDDAARTLHPPLELYDLMADPLERESLAERVEHSAVLDDLRAKLLGWMTETDDPLLTGLPVPPALQRTLGMLKLLHGET
jgi:arylsulfatase A-like enzyme